MTEGEQSSGRRGFGGGAARGSATVPTTARRTPGGAERNGDTTTAPPVSSTTAPNRREARAATVPAAAAARTRSGGRDRAPAAGSAPTKKQVARKPRRARLRLTQMDAWSVMKTAFLLSIALGIVSVVAVGIIWSVLGAAGVFDSLNNTVQTVLGNNFRLQDYVGTGRVLGFTMLVSVVNVVLLTAIATLGAFLYNLAATLLGGVELTLTEDG